MYLTCQVVQFSHWFIKSIRQIKNIGRIKRYSQVLFWLVCLFPASAFAVEKMTVEVAANDKIDPYQLVKSAFDQWRGMSSYGEVSMTIHRPDWQRTMKMHNWTKGEKDALIRFVEPVKDAGNATLKLDNDMWMYTPKLNQVIKLPASMMTQSWMGSDFSYNDLAKSDQLLTSYDLTLIKAEIVAGVKQYTIEAIPKSDAPVVWGKELLVIREDKILILERFYDQSMQPVKEMRTLKIDKIGGRLYPVIMRMINFDEEDRWTQVETHEAYFNIQLPNYIFTRSNLRNPRPWSID
ncbi:outer membrane lipoprotein-sorting protein [Aliikangiella marina]|uniref:Outer membrane lipoprotein-sorting protein n=1 Tax=Aliikangiella marina TaxID=1712262 RepID=A0A545TCR9_9GAMM|nr:outer membrane lipoprotein-sorting protein [Aliikangiella marina]TQV74976.1 outer membrane lipoprotein-sorting protein [Aliikangiella marina]